MDKTDIDKQTMETLLELQFTVVYLKDNELCSIITKDKTEIYNLIKDLSKNSNPYKLFGVKDSYYSKMVELDGNLLLRRIKNFVKPSYWSEEEINDVVELLEQNIRSVDEFYDKFIKRGNGRSISAVNGMKSKIKTDFVNSQKLLNPEFHIHGICRNCKKFMIPKLILEGNDGSELVIRCPYCFSDIK